MQIDYFLFYFYQQVSNMSGYKRSILKRFSQKLEVLSDKEDTICDQHSATQPFSLSQSSLQMEKLKTVLWSDALKFDINFGQHGHCPEE